MPDVLFPQLLEHCKTIAACVIVESASPELAEWAKGKQGTDLIAKIEELGEPHWIEVTADDWGDKGVHFHVEVHKGEVDTQGGRPFRVGDSDEVKRFITEFIDTAGRDTEQFAFSHCHLMVPLSELPQHGTIATLLAFERRSCDASFGLTAATLDIEDDFFDKLVFRLEPDETNLVKIELMASSFFSLTDAFLIELSSLVELGVDCFVFEQISREPSYVS